MCCICGVTNNRYNPDLTGKNFLITGGTKGFGRKCIEKLISLNAVVIFCGRTKSLASDIIKKARIKYPLAKIEYFYCDFLKLSSVEIFASNFKKKYDKLHCLVHNIGGIEIDTITEDGYNSIFQLNYLSSFY